MVILVIVTHPRSRHSPKEANGVTHMYVRYLMIIAPSNVKLFVTPRVLMPAATRYAHTHLILCVESSSLAYIPGRFCLVSRIMTPHHSAWCIRLYPETYGMFSNKLTEFVVSHFYPAHLTPTWPTTGVEAWTVPVSRCLTMIFITTISGASTIQTNIILTTAFIPIYSSREVDLEKMTVTTSTTNEDIARHSHGIPLIYSTLLVPYRDMHSGATAKSELDDWLFQPPDFLICLGVYDCPYHMIPALTFEFKNIS